MKDENTTVKVLYDLSPALVEGAIRDKLIEMGWTPPEPKPKNKIIDLSKMVGSDIDMEFWDTLPSIYVGKLEKILDLSPKQYCRKNGINFDNCRVRQDHWHHWTGGECPLPEGLIITVKFLGGAEYDYLAYSNLQWVEKFEDGRRSGNNIIAFKVIGVADGYRYEWEEE